MNTIQYTKMILFTTTCLRNLISLCCCVFIMFRGSLGNVSTIGLKIPSKDHNSWAIRKVTGHTRNFSWTDGGTIVSVCFLFLRRCFTRKKFKRQIVFRIVVVDVEDSKRSEWLVENSFGDTFIFTSQFCLAEATNKSTNNFY